MVRASIFLLAGMLLAAGGVDRALARPNPAAAASAPTLWARIVSPHEAEVTHILMLVGRHYEGAVLGYIDGYEDELTESQRRHLLRELYGMLRYAARRAPTRPEVQLWLGRVADELGERHTAVAALETYLKSTTQEALDVTALARLGRNLFAIGRDREGLAMLRRALATGEATEARNAAIFDLAQVHMLGGALPLAIDLLQSASQASGLGGATDLRLQLALAVAFDRDEQLSRAHEQLTGISVSLGGEDLIALLEQRIPVGLFLSALDYLYYQALILELGEALSEARNVWLAYAQAPREAAPYRDRALAHVRAIDSLLSERAGSAGKRAGTVAPTGP